MNEHAHRQLRQALAWMEAHTIIAVCEPSNVVTSDFQRLLICADSNGLAPLPLTWEEIHRFKSRVKRVETSHVVLIVGEDWTPEDVGAACEWAVSRYYGTLLVVPPAKVAEVQHSQAWEERDAVMWFCEVPS